MALVRIVFLSAVLAGILFFVFQNLSPSLPLVFLGFRTRVLPLSLWILLAFLVGVFTHLAIAALFKLSNYFAIRQFQSFIPETPRSGASPRTPPPPRQSYTPPPDSRLFEEDEDDLEDPREPIRDSVRAPINYEVRQTPQSEFRSGSVYSYSYKTPTDSGVGKTEAVYDADYRVIVPPVPEPEDEDWGLDEDDADWNTPRTPPGN